MCIYLTKPFNKIRFRYWACRDESLHMNQLYVSVGNK